MKHYLYLLLPLLLLLAGCSKRPDHPRKVDMQPDIYPDYVGVTIPAGIAPLDFAMADRSVTRIDVTVKGSKGGELHASGSYADFDIDAWHRLTEQNKGGHLVLTVCAEKDGEWVQYNDFNIQVSQYALDDYGLTYRRIPPGYEVGGNIGLYQRDIHSFDEFPLLTEMTVPGRCMNCHTARQNNPDRITLQIRGENGGTLIQKDGVQQWLDTKTDSTKAAGSYASWHPGGDYCVYAANAVHQSFYVGTGQRIEVYHSFSNVVMLDTRSNELILSPLMMTDDLEIFPAFSAAGDTVYYSTSKPCRVPAEYDKVKCSLCAIPFDAKAGRWGDKADTLLNARTLDKSFTLARPSYDGKWLMYAVSDCGNFPVCRPEADLWLMNLQTRETRPLHEVNSPQTESWHCWSTNSRWFVFASKRENGMYAQLFIAGIDDKGKVSKPFLLPQRNPRKFYDEMMDSYNVADFTTKKVEFDAREAYRQVFNQERIKVKIK